jgi:4-amino-4-deoxy-L-arabinose transferase-like glycosyltransferase
MPLTEAEAFCLAWIVPCWVAFELVQTKLPHYPMPLYPGLALLVAHSLSTSASAQARAGRHLTAARVLWLAVGSVLVVGTPVAAWAVGGMMRDTWLTLLTLAATLTGGTLLFVAARALQQQRSGRAILAGVLALASAETLVCTLLPHAQALWLAPRVVGLVDAVDPQHRRPLAAVEFHEDSLVFLTAGRVERIVAADLPAWLRSHPGGLAIVPHQANHTLRGLHTLGEAEGFNYSKGRWLRLRLIEQAQARRDGAPHRRAPEPS